VVLRQENVDTLRRLGTLVNLTADEETLFERVARRDTRPLLRSDDPRATLSELLRVRTPRYRAAADFEVDTSALAREEVAQAILSRIESVAPMSASLTLPRPAAVGGRSESNSRSSRVPQSWASTHAASRVRTSRAALPSSAPG
jgi:hypothetical protein